MAYFTAIFDDFEDGVLLSSTNVIIPYDGDQYTCSQIEQYLASLTSEQRLVWRSLSTTQPPPPPTDFEVALRGCSGPITSSSWSADTDFGPDLIDDRPSWALLLRYSYASGVLTLEAPDTIGQIKFERQDGTAFSTTNPDNVPIQSGNFYPSGDLDDGNYKRRWQINLGIFPMKITAEQDGGSATVVYQFTPTANANRINL
ncbi:hypothetical protein [Spirosoma sp.]|uniref:hypothetical protein n=1 Tax=Spirosoma sp. TaxID=1899569 RepID=UPI002635C85E|nr:hypothetical protein [Spirosoma sp.]MCX6216495.1 hypothetical protein [Spirosoma sp.]